MSSEHLHFFKCNTTLMFALWKLGFKFYRQRNFHFRTLCILTNPSMIGYKNILWNVLNSQVYMNIRRIY